jgi:hypothetical protein
VDFFHGTSSRLAGTAYGSRRPHRQFTLGWLRPGLINKEVSNLHQPMDEISACAGYQFEWAWVSLR